MKIKESENINKDLDIARNLEQLWNMKVILKPIVVGTFATVS